MATLLFIKWLWFKYNLTRKYNSSERKIGKNLIQNIERAKKLNLKSQIYIDSSYKAKMFNYRAKYEISKLRKKSLSDLNFNSDEQISKFREDMWESFFDNFTKKRKKDKNEWILI